MQVLYKFTINTTKVSILCLYLRIFPNKTFRKAAWVVMFFVVGYAASSILATIFQCTPLSKTFHPQTPGKCLNLTAFWYTNAVANILGDCAILALPMPVLYALHLPRRQKFGLMMIFAIGFLYTCLLDPLGRLADSNQRLYNLFSAYDYTRPGLQSPRSNLWNV